jgi:predicted phage terminase large subunit-like protein
MSSLPSWHSLPKEIQLAISNPDLILDELARRNFYEFRQRMNPKLKVGWFVEDAARELQQFYADWRSGLRPILILSSPPQHGKSLMVIDFIAWVCGRHPEARTIFASFSERLGVRANLALQRMFESERYQTIFPETIINTSNTVTVAGRALRNREIVEFVDRGGYFRNTTVEGSVTGESLDLGVIDDPIKGRAEANSKTKRDKTWDWLQDDFMTRFDDWAALLMVLTRWHVDDVAGRIIEAEERARALVYEAIATKDDGHRAEGEALFPEVKSLEFLLGRRSAMTEGSWTAMYQGSPIVVGGGLFPIDRFVIIDHPPLKKDIAKTVRYWDKAGSADKGDYTAGSLMHYLKDGRIVIEHMERGQWQALDREKRIQQTAALDGKQVPIWMEQEPGSGGKDSVEASIRGLIGYNAKAHKKTGNKDDEWEPYAAQVQAGNVYLVRGDWNRAFIEEHEVAPNGANDDQIDASAGAFKKLVGASVMDYTRLTTL